jgi:hypothetical protein
LLALGSGTALAGTQGFETFFVINDTDTALLLTPPPPTNPTSDFFTTYTGLLGIPNPPPAVIGPGLDNAVSWWVSAAQPFDLSWSVVYGVQIGNTTLVSQYCTFGGDTTVTSDVTEGVIAICSSGENGTGQTGPGFYQISFQDAWSPTDPGEGGQFTVTEGASLAPVPEPSSLMIVGAGVLGLGVLRRYKIARKNPVLALGGS